MRHRVWPKIAGSIALVILLLIIFWNWDWFIPWVDAGASSALGRKVTIQHLHVRLGLTTIARAGGITIANPDGFAPGEPQFGQIGQLLVALDIPDYIRHRTLSLTRIEIDHPVFNIRQLGSRNNYTLPASSGPSGNPPRLGELVINNGMASVILPGYKTNFELLVQTRPAPAGSRVFTGGEIVVDAKGTYAGAPITGRFIGGALLSLRDNAAPYPIDLHVQNGSTTASLAGTLNDPAHFAGARLLLRFTGQNMADLYQLTGVPIPATPPYSLTGHVDYTGHAFRFENFTGHMGSSDLEGSIVEIPGSPRRQVNADLTSQRVDLTDLAGFLGATPGNAKTPGQNAATKAQVAQAAQKPNLLPHTPINLPKINAANVDLKYHGAKIINKNVPLDNLTVHLIIQDGHITAAPLNFAVGTGSIASNIDLKPATNGLAMRAKIDFHRLQLSRIMASTQAFAGDGTVGGSAWLSGSGDSLAQILGHGDGHAALFMQNGADISALLVDLAGLEGGDAILSALGVPNKTVIQCMVSDFSLNDGLMNTNTFLLATKEANILGSGKANLQTEKLDLQMWTEATHFTIGSLSTPINIRGTLKNPSILPAPGPLGARLGGAIGLGVLFPPLAILPTIRLGLGDRNACVDTITAWHQGHAHNPK